MSDTEARKKNIGGEIFVGILIMSKIGKKNITIPKTHQFLLRLDS